MNQRTEQSAVFPLMDIHQVGFLRFHNVEISQTVSNGRVIFQVPGTREVAELLDRFAKDEMVPVSSYSACVKATRGQMLQMRPAR